MSSYDGMWESRLRVAGYPENPIGLEQLIRSEREAKERARELRNIKAIFEDEGLPLTAESIRSLLKRKNSTDEELRESKKEVEKLKNEVKVLKNTLEKLTPQLRRWSYLELGYDIG
ncbi:MAG TPA: hypothetical protein VF173_06980 [Thermoanaerobaculia bacterium]|nr:hypothetical protein [Thermoanaerobaculia bacterium]